MLTNDPWNWRIRTRMRQLRESEDVVRKIDLANGVSAVYLSRHLFVIQLFHLMGPFGGS